MKRMALVGLVVEAAAAWFLPGPAAARIFAAVTDPNACVQMDYRAVAPVTLSDPNAAVGAVLGPVPGDPNAWEVPAGAWKREPALVCDPDPNDQVVAIEYRGGSGPAQIDFEPGASLWSFSTVVPEGPAGYLFTVIDSCGAERLVWIWLIGVPNSKPTLY